MNYKTIVHHEINDNFLDSFERYQNTSHIYTIDEAGLLQIKEEHYIDEWDNEKKKQVIHILRYYLELGGAVISITQDQTLLGFAALNGKTMGSKKQYLNLGFIHVHYKHRGKGIGKKLFADISQEARNRNVEKLYIGANPAIDTYHFYKSVGCELATEIINEVYDHEPLDLQLEYTLF